MLHAWRLELDHPDTGARLVVEAPLPESFHAAVRLLEQPLPELPPRRAPRERFDRAAREPSERKAHAPDQRPRNRTRRQ